MDVKSEPDEEDLPDLIDLDLIKTENVVDEDSVDSEIKLEKLQCTSCSQTFNCEYLLKVHQMLHDPNQYCFICKRKFVNNFDAHVMGKHFNQCDLCLKTFTEGKTLKRHMELHTGNLSYLKCNLCDKVFRQKGSLNIHIRASHNGIKPFTCTECENSISFTTSSGLKRHQNRFHDPNNPDGRSNRVHECSYCFASLESYKAKKAHETKHRSNTCETCKETFNTTLDVRKHFALVHAMPDRVTCEECWMCFKKKYSLQRHIEAAHRGVIYNCQKCDISYRNKSSLLKHNNKFHDPKNPYEIKKDYKCTICSETFTNLAQKRNHAAKHCRGKLHCGVCEKIFESVQLLEKHLREDHNHAKSCPHCHELFSKFELVNHIRIKHKERKCFHCPKVLHVYSDFHSHLLSHKIPIICEICGKNLEKCNIEKHMRNHYKGLVKRCRICKKLVTNLELHYNRVHTCSLCDIKQLFRSSIAMRVHYTRHHPNIRKCTVCQKNVLKSHFKQHMKGKHNQQVYECDKCAKVFYRHHIFDAHREKYCKGEIEEQEPLQCHLCDINYSDTRHFMNHMIDFHSPKILEDEDELERNTFQRLNLNYEKKVEKYQCIKCFQVMRKDFNHTCFPKEPTNGYYRCDICGWLMLRLCNIKKHTAIIHGQPDHWIKINEDTNDRRPLARFEFNSFAMRKQKMLAKRKCKDCRKLFKNEILLKRHLCVNVGGHYCHLCGTKYLTRKYYLLHMRKNHSPTVTQRLEESTVMKIADKKYQCKGCKIIGKMRSIKNHFCGLSRPANPGFYSSGKKNANKRKHCDKCGFSCLRNTDMVKHVLKYHFNEKEEKLLSGNEMTREDEAAADAPFSEELDFKMKMKIEVEEMMQQDMDLGCLVDCIVKSEDSV